jgi:hypothetical protein
MLYLPPAILKASSIQAPWRCLESSATHVKYGVHSELIIAGTATAVWKLMITTAVGSTTVSDAAIIYIFSLSSSKLV